jgi:Cd2+/Zn2+-exporting ATPase
VDGAVVAGRSHVNQAPITGESLPVSKGPDDEVFAGTINGDGSLNVRCTKPAEDSTLAQIIRLVRDAQSKRAAVEQWVDRFAHVYTPAVMAMAVLVLFLPPLLHLGTWSEWLYRSLVLLVIACPCALVISTPVSIVAGLAASARHGVLVKGGVHLETFARLKAFAFDKTGTLTEGEPRVTKVIALDGHAEADVLGVAAAIESRSLHPLARAIVAEASARKVAVRAAEDVQILPGKGAQGRSNGTHYWLGSHRLLEERGQETTEVRRHLEELAAIGSSAVVVGADDHVCGLIGVADRVRASAERALRELREAGAEHIAMLTGDNRAVAGLVGRRLDLQDVRAELLPQDKVAAVEELVARFGHLAMIGDGVNDAPSMARATLGVAMGAAGSDAAIETADIALMSDDLLKLPWLLKHSRRVVRVIHQNIFFSLLVKAVFVALTFAGVATLWGAIAADMGASLLVIFNGLRLLHDPFAALRPEGWNRSPLTGRAVPHAHGDVR